LASSLDLSCSFSCVAVLLCIYYGLGNGGLQGPQETEARSLVSSLHAVRRMQAGSSKLTNSTTRVLMRRSLWALCSLRETTPKAAKDTPDVWATMAMLTLSTRRSCPRASIDNKYHYRLGPLDPSLHPFRPFLAPQRICRVAIPPQISLLNTVLLHPPLKEARSSRNNFTELFILFFFCLHCTIIV